VIQYNNIKEEINPAFGRHFMASLLWNTEPDKMLTILKVMIRTYKEYGLPIEYGALGIEEV